MFLVRWLDTFIDYSHQTVADRTVGSRFDFGPYSRAGSVANVVLCAIFAVVCIVTGANGTTLPGYGGAIFLGALEVVFVRICLRAFRGDFEAIVLDPDDDADTPR